MLHKLHVSISPVADYVKEHSNFTIALPRLTKTASSFCIGERNLQLHPIDRHFPEIVLLRCSLASKCWHNDSSNDNEDTQSEENCIKTEFLKTKSSRNPSSNRKEKKRKTSVKENINISCTCREILSSISYWMDEAVELSVIITIHKLHYMPWQCNPKWNTRELKD